MELQWTMSVSMLILYVFTNNFFFAWLFILPRCVHVVGFCCEAATSNLDRLISISWNLWMRHIGGDFYICHLFFIQNQIRKRPRSYSESVIENRPRMKILSLDNLSLKSQSLVLLNLTVLQFFRFKKTTQS